MWKKLSNLYKTQISRSEKLLFAAVSISAVIGCVLLLINHFHENFNGNQFVSWSIFAGLPVIIILYTLALYVRDSAPRIALVTLSYTQFFIMLLGLGTLVYAIQLTPFHPIDATLVKADQLLGFNQVALLNWTHAHPTINNFFTTVYGLIGFELPLIPLLVALCLEKRSITLFLFSLTFSFVIGCLIYYFWPTIAPAAMFSDPNFLTEQHATALKFYQIHHHLPITTRDGGLIAFPSFHVTWSILLAYALIKRKWLFYPIAALNFCIILSTMFLGWHYLIDVLGGVGLAASSIWFATITEKRCTRPITTTQNTRFTLFQYSSFTKIFARKGDTAQRTT